MFSLSDYTPSSPDPEINAILTSVMAVICAMNRFYAENARLVNPETPRLILLNRIASGLEIELTSFHLDRLYAADLIHLGEKPEIGIRGRQDEKPAVALDLTFGRPRTSFLRKYSGPYRLGLSLGLKRKTWRAGWFTPEDGLKREMNHYFPIWSIEIRDPDGTFALH